MTEAVAVDLVSAAVPSWTDHDTNQEAMEYFSSTALSGWLTHFEICIRGYGLKTLFLYMQYKVQSTTLHTRGAAV